MSPVLKTPTLIMVFSVTETKWILACDISCHQCFCPDDLHLKKSHITDVMEHHHWTLKNNKKKNNSGLQKRQTKININTLLPSPDVSSVILPTYSDFKYYLLKNVHLFALLPIFCNFKLSMKITKKKLESDWLNVTLILVN